MGFFKNKGHFFNANDLSLEHEDGKERAKYGTANSTTSQKGTDGKKNNSSKYNHEYYLANKEKWKEGDSDFDESNFNENNLIPGTDLYSFQRKDGSTVVLFEDNKWVLPKGSKLDKDTTARLQKLFKGKISKNDADKVTAALNEGKKNKTSAEKKSDEETSGSKKSGSSSSSKSSGGSGKKSSGGKGKKSSGSKKKSSDESSSKKSSGGGSKKSSSGKKQSSAKTEEDKQAEELKKQQEQQKMKQEAESYQKMLAEQKEAQLKAQEEQNATGTEITEEDLKEAEKRVSSKSKNTSKTKKLTKQNAQYAKHFDEHGSIIRYFDRRY